MRVFAEDRIQDLAWVAPEGARERSEGRWVGTPESTCCGWIKMHRDRTLGGGPKTEVIVPPQAELF